MSQDNIAVLSDERLLVAQGLVACIEPMYATFCPNWSASWWAFCCSFAVAGWRVMFSVRVLRLSTSSCHRLNFCCFSSLS